MSKLTLVERNLCQCSSFWLQSPLWMPYSRLEFCSPRSNKVHTTDSNLSLRVAPRTIGVGCRQVQRLWQHHFYQGWSHDKVCLARSFCCPSGRWRQVLTPQGEPNLTSFSSCGTFVLYSRKSLELNRRLYDLAFSHKCSSVRWQH